jgi:preprotein translocase subunit SecG
MYASLIALFVITCVVLIISVLLQSGKGGGLAGAFGGGAMSQAVFGGRGAATFLSKLTTYAAIAYFILAVFIAIIAKPTVQTAAPKSVVEEEVQKSMEAKPAQTEEGTTDEGVGVQPANAPEAIPGEAPAAVPVTPAPPAGEQPPPSQQEGGQ